MSRYFRQGDYHNSPASPQDSYLSITTQGNKSQFTTPENTSHLPLSRSKSKPITPGNNPRLPTRQSAEKARSWRQIRDESVASKYSINMTRMEELFPEYSQRNVHDFSPLETLPNAQELVSGVFQDGSLVFSPHAKKPRASRFVSASHAKDNSTKAEVHTVDDIAPRLDVKKPRASRFSSASYSRDVSLRVEPVIEQVPPPFDEKKVLASLEFLEMKVAALEKNRAQDEITIQQLQLENQMPRTESKERKKLRRSDSALGSTDGGSERGDEMSSIQRRLTVEKKRLEASVRTLQEQIGLLNRVASETEINLGKIIKDRDSAVSQLGVAYFTIEKLKADNQTLRERNSMLKRSVDELIANQDDTTMNMTTKEEALNRGFEQRERLGAKEKELEKQQRLQKELTTTQPAMNTEPPCKESAPESEALHEGQATRSGSISSQLSIPDSSDSTRDLTYLSVVSAGEIGELRKMLESERIARSKKNTSRHQPSKTDFAVEDQTSDKTTQQLKATYKSPTVEPVNRRDSMTGFLIEGGSSDDRTQQLKSTRKAPMIEPIRRQVSMTGSLIEKDSSDDISQRLEPTQKSSGNEPDRRREDTSAMSTRGPHGTDKIGNMTSDWMINDNTQDISGSKVGPPTLSGEFEIPYFDHLPPIVTRREEQESATLRKEPKVLSKPVPMVKEATEPTPHEEEPTLRPSQPPALALASVIRGLEDELLLAKRQLAQYQDLYNNQNPALAKRARKSLKEKMEKLLRTIDGKADHIYSLYDVVEGQKQQGQGMTDEQLQATLKSMGIEIPWEGIQSTSETQRSCSTNRSRRSS